MNRSFLPELLICQNLLIHNYVYISTAGKYFKAYECHLFIIIYTSIYLGDIALCISIRIIKILGQLNETV